MNQVWERCNEKRRSGHLIVKMENDRNSPPKKRQRLLMNKTQHAERRKYAEELKRIPMKQSTLKEKVNESTQNNYERDQNTLPNRIQHQNNVRANQPTTPNVRRHIPWESKMNYETNEFSYDHITTRRSNSNKRNKSNQQNVNNNEVDDDSSDDVENNNNNSVNDVANNQLPDRFDVVDDEELDFEEVIHSESIMRRQQIEMNVVDENNINNTTQSQQQQRNQSIQKGKQIVAKELERKKAEAKQVWNSIRLSPVVPSLSERELTNLNNYECADLTSDNSSQEFKGSDLFDIVRKMRQKFKLQDNETEAVYNALKEVATKAGDHNVQENIDQLPTFETFNRLENKSSIK